MYFLTNILFGQFYFIFSSSYISYVLLIRFLICKYFLCKQFLSKSNLKYLEHSAPYGGLLLAPVECWQLLATWKGLPGPSNLIKKTFEFLLYHHGSTLGVLGDKFHRIAMSTDLEFSLRQHF